VSTVRPAAVAGLFYPGDADVLLRAVRDHLPSPAAGPSPEAVIVPHAGYPYSGAIAGRAYARLAAGRDVIRHVVLVGPAHRDVFRGLATTSADAWRTPLGDVPIDETLRGRALACPGVTVRDRAHAEEHSLEVQLPFLQVVLDRFTLLPLVAGDVEPEAVADVLEALQGGPETVIVVSSDLSHFHPYAEARALDAETAAAIERRDGASIGPYDACGHAGVAGVLALARRRGLEVERLDLRNSGDTAGDRDRVVGYGAWALVGAAGAP
jgi:AmmeMemoRadiSam system protein B